MSELSEAAKRFKAAMIAREAQAADAIVTQYKAAYGRISPSARTLISAIKTRQAEGKPVSRAWLQRQERYQTLLQQIAQEMTQFSQFASEQVRASVLQALAQGEQDAQQLTLLAVPDEARRAEVLLQWNRLPIETLTELQGFLSPDSPVSRLFASLPIQTQATVKSVLFTGVAAGLNPRQIARQVRQSTDYSLTRALTISRTETLRAYRAASQETYRANDDVVLLWEWIATLSVRTCAACLALHGKRFPLSVEFGSHPNCRCTALPVTEDSGEPGDGAGWFDRQDAETQRMILGKGKYEAYHAGKITLPDLIQEQESSVWGRSYTEASLKQALHNATRRKN